jgi:hypothetical protein
MEWPDHHSGRGSGSSRIVSFGRLIFAPQRRDVWPDRRGSLPIWSTWYQPGSSDRTELSIASAEPTSVTPSRSGWAMH